MNLSLFEGAEETRPYCLTKGGAWRVGGKIYRPVTREMTDAEAAGRNQGLAIASTLAWLPATNCAHWPTTRHAADMALAQTQPEPSKRFKVTITKKETWHDE